MPHKEHPVFRFECPMCQRKLARSTILKEHMRCHTGEKPFACAICKETFARNYDRKQHEKIHTLKFRFTCHGILPSGFRWGCGAGFHRKHDLVRHHKSKAGSQCKIRLQEMDVREAIDGKVDVDVLVASSPVQHELSTDKLPVLLDVPGLLQDSRESTFPNLMIPENSLSELPFDDDRTPIHDNDLVLNDGRPQHVEPSAQLEHLFQPSLISRPAPSPSRRWSSSTSSSTIAPKLKLPLLDTNTQSQDMQGFVGDRNEFEQMFEDFCNTNQSAVVQIRDSRTSPSQSVESTVQIHPGPVRTDLQDVQEVNETESSGSEDENHETWEENQENVKAYAKIEGREFPSGEEWSYFVRETRVRIGRSADSHGNARNVGVSNAVSKFVHGQLSVDIGIAPHKSVPRQHALIFWDADKPSSGGWHIQVCGRNGVFINGRLLERGSQQQIVSGDRFMIRNTDMTFRTPDAIVEDDETAQENDKEGSFDNQTESESEESFRIASWNNDSGTDSELFQDA